MPNKPWTQQEVELLLSKKAIPTRSKKSIHRKLVSLGLRKPKYKIGSHSKKPWTEEEINLLKQNKIIPNRSKNSIDSMKRRLNLKIKNYDYKKRFTPWKKKEENLLKKLVQQKETARTIFNMGVLPYSRNSIQKKMCHMGLAKKSPMRNIFSKEDKEKFKNFLLDNWVNKTPEELMKYWNKNNQNKVSKSKVVYHLTNLKIKIPYGEVAKIKNQKKKEEFIKVSFHKNSKTFEENIRLTRAEIMRSRMLKGRDIWTGLPCEPSLEEKEEELV